MTVNSSVHNILRILIQTYCSMHKFCKTSVKIIGLNLLGINTGIHLNASCYYDKDKMKQYEGKVIDGKTFKSKFPKYYPCKVVGNNTNAFKYKLGLIKNDEAFNPHGSCKSGGLYFTDAINVYDYYGDYGKNCCFGFIGQ